MLGEHLSVWDQGLLKEQPGVKNQLLLFAMIESCSRSGVLIMISDGIPLFERITLEATGIFTVEHTQVI